MSITVTPFLRNVLHADALISGAAGLLMMLGTPLLSPLLELPAQLLFWAGLVLVPFVAMLVVIARRATVSKLVMIDIIAINVLWVVASFGLLVSGVVAPNALGIAFVVAQALAVAVFAELQFIGIRRATSVVAAA
ncbi:MULTISPECIES: hypothetical protein [Aminobacter]|uniref:Integral membrane protein n=1 Tax=Aminobacter ciceronei TaxID=150723 RepID=A0ABR6CDW0_9HYPH|nr:MULTISPECIES: hypothetical protein [Aminobacter]MBA8909201.1 hypothetical protein [Aminobacter ciceronei]MBA9022941.1 hypothetical protein [Aminobacter ciceronei]WMC98601.1 hypothetical protein RAR13_07885 [Aminobacter aminovorans]BBD36898.1 membrane protein [Aminobacter sp. SS-2016]